MKYSPLETLCVLLLAEIEQRIVAGDKVHHSIVGLCNEIRKNLSKEDEKLLQLISQYEKLF